MSLNLVNNYIQTFSTNVQLLLQQRGSKLEGSVTTGTYTGKQASPVDQVGAISAQRVTSRFEPMPRMDVPTDRRWVFPVDYDVPGLLVDTLDKLRLAIQPEGAFVQAALYAMGRAKDDEIIAAFFGNAATGENGATSVSFPSSQVVGVNVGGTASNLNVPKLREAKRILMANEVDFDMEEPTAIITSKEHDSLLNEIQVVSLDYNDRPVLVDGRVTRVLGINIKTCERLTTGIDDQSGTSRQIPVYVKSGMHLGTWADVSVDIAQRKDLRNLPWQAYVMGTFGATRIEEKRVVKIWCR